MPQAQKTLAQPVDLLLERRLTHEWNGKASTYDYASECLLSAATGVVFGISE